MSNKEALSKIQPLGLDTLVAELKNESSNVSKEAGMKLAQEADKFGLPVREYLQLAIKTDPVTELDGYEQTLAALNLPVGNNFKDGIYLQAASETFQTYAGTRALFPEVIDDVLRFANRQDQIETVQPMLSNSRTINGVEVLSTVVEDDSDARDTHTISEMGRIPVDSIKTSQNSVKIYKHGRGIRTTYEFSRRASLDLLVPYLNRISRQLELSKVKVATSILINGDGAYTAAGSVAQASFDTKTNVTATAGELSWPHILAWLVSRAKAGTPVDTVVMNWDGWLQWLMLFATEKGTGGATGSESLSRAGVSLDTGATSILAGVTPVLSSAMPDNTLIGYTRGETMEELVEAGSNIEETERVIANQTVTMYKTENTGYRLVFGDTRSVFTY